MHYLLLTKNALLSLFGINRILHAKTAEEKQAAKKRLVLLAVMSLCFIMLSNNYATALAEDGEAGVAAALSGIYALLFLMGVTAVRATLFQAKDGSLSFTLPVSHAAIAASRLTLLVVWSLYYALLLMVPFAVSYAAQQGAGIGFLLRLLPLTLLLTLIPTALGAILGILVVTATAGLKRGAVFSTVLRFFVIALATMVAVGASTGESLLTKGMQGLRESLLTPKLVAAAWVGGSAVSFLTLLAVAVLLCFIALLLAKRTLLPVTTRLQAAQGQSVKRDRQPRQQGNRPRTPFQALLALEWKRFWTTPLYLFSTALGPLALVVLAVFVLIKGETLLAVLDFDPALIRTLLPALVSFVPATCSYTIYSIAIEGRASQQFCALPLNARERLNAKRAMQVILYIPAELLLALSCMFRLSVTGLDALMLLLLPPVMTICFGELGLMLARRNPNTNWTLEAEVFRQNAVAMLSFLLCAVIGGIVLVAFAMLGSFGGVMSLGATALVMLFLHRRNDAGGLWRS